MIRVPPRTGACAHCVDEKDDLTLASWNGRIVWLCRSCRDPATALAVMAPEPAGQLVFFGRRIRGTRAS